MHQIAIRRGHHAYVDADGFGTAEALEFALLQDAQQLALKIERQIADLIQEYGAAIRLFESPNTVLQGAGECAAGMAEKLRFEQVFR